MVRMTAEDKRPGCGFKALSAWSCYVVLVGTLGLLLPACATLSPRTATSQPAVPTEGNGALMDYIADQAYVTAEPAYRAVYILWKDEVFAGDFAALSAELHEGGIIPAKWNFAPNQMIDRGTVGYMVCRAAEIRTGLNWQLTGLGRYAWRELNYLRIASPLSEYGYVPGGQFIGVLARAEEHMHRRDRGAGPIELGDEP